MKGKGEEGGREGGNPPNKANLPGRRADRLKKQSVVSSNPASVGAREDDGARNQRGGEREGACLPIGGGGSSGCGFALSFPHACFRRFFFYFVLDGRVGGNGSAAGAPVSTRRGSVTELGRRRRREVGRRTRDGRLRCLGGRVSSVVWLVASGVVIMDSWLMAMCSVYEMCSRI
jgi:hypothetical protein